MQRRDDDGIEARIAEGLAILRATWAAELERDAANERREAFEAAWNEEAA